MLDNDLNGQHQFTQRQFEQMQSIRRREVNASVNCNKFKKFLGSSIVCYSALVFESV